MLTKPENCILSDLVVKAMDTVVYFYLKKKKLFLQKNARKGSDALPRGVRSLAQADPSSIPNPNPNPIWSLMHRHWVWDPNKTPSL